MKALIRYELGNLLGELDIANKPVSESEARGWFTKIAPIGTAGKDNLIFINDPNEDTMKILSETKASCILLENRWGLQHLDDIRKIKKNIYFVEHPRLVVAKLLKHIWGEKNIPGIHATAIIDNQADIHDSVFIGPYCIIGKCLIEEDTKIHAYTIIKDSVKIGKNVIIREQCVIGSQGFSFAREKNGALFALNHIGGIVIGDNVEIFPFTNIDRGTFEDTVIESGTKIDHFVHVGHNARLGRNCLITAGVVLAGHIVVGESCLLGIGSVIKQGIKIGNDVTVGMGSVVIRNVADGEIVAGVPARPLRRKSGAKV